MLGFLKKLFGTSQERTLRRFSKIVEKINHWEEAYTMLSDDALRAKTGEFRARIASGESVDSILPEAYGAIKAVCRRLVGTEVHVSGYNQKWDMVPYDVQLIGAIAMHYGYISEMQTGEGKTLTATLALYLNALTGKPVHLVTVNDYLVKRDCEWVGTILRWMGLKTAVLANETPQHIRKEVYQADVVYGTASEFGFDYLRDNSMCMSAEEQVQRGFYFAIVDEVDSILVDEARTPLIISGPSPKSFQMYAELKDGVAELVKMQRDLCSRLASEAKRYLEHYFEAERVEKFSDQEKEACRKLWVISRAMPRNKVLRRAKEQPDIRAEIDRWDVHFHGEHAKEERTEELSILYIIVDEKGNDFELTDRGIQAWTAVSGGENSDFVMLDLGEEYAKIDQDASASHEEKLEKKLAINEEDARRKERAHNIRQCLRAHLLMERDIDYIIDDGKIVIIDENTGRPQPGRRYSDGLHQAIEAKEGVSIQKETQTYATVTLQNYFRMYTKLAGMTGTAITEASEFKEIYKLDVLQIPTYKASMREDFNDEVYMTEREKFNALLKEIKEIHGKGRPILIGTESVEASEKLSRILKQARIEHTVLNAKNHAKEAEIIAEAGRPSAVTVATNMAGRGTDIKLKDGVAAFGGLHVIATTRHHSRRIDRQLRGRSARLGDPGSSKFFISFEDELLRFFSSPKLTALIQRFRPPEGEAISSRIINRSIEIAQKRLEARNFMIRKHTLEYDDVMNKQREAIYSFRNEILHTKEPLVAAEELIRDACASGAAEFLVSRSKEGGWNPEGFREWLYAHFPVSFEIDELDNDNLSLESLEKEVGEKVVLAFREKLDADIAKTGQADIQQIALSAVRSLMVHRIDALWQEHLATMDHLRVEVMLRAVAQKDPLLEFKHEAFALFEKLSHRLKMEIAKSLFKIQFTPVAFNLFHDLADKIQLEKSRLIFDGMEELKEPMNIGLHNNESSKQPEKDHFDAAAAPKGAIPVLDGPSIRQAPKVGRNDLCPCMSGKKYKNCCGQAQEPLHN